MDRRTFLGVTISGILAQFGSGCARSGVTPSLTSAPRPRGLELEEASIADLAGRMARGDCSSRELVDAYLARIEAVDRKGPALKSVLEINPEAQAIATRLDEERRSKGARGPLHGIPLLVKDNIDTGDRMQTTAGSLALLGTPALRDAHVVARLRDAGAIILGKTNLSEWANMRDSHSVSGWSARGGLTKNPYVLNRNTSGSSSGSASAVAANLAAAAIGTETDGSIVSPAQLCGLVGLKPTVGLVSRAGIIPIAHSQDTAGPMTRTVADTAILLGAIAGADPRDPATSGARAERDYTRFLTRDGARGARIGVLRGERWMTPALMATLDAAIAALRKLGATVVEIEAHAPEEAARAGARALGDIAKAVEAPELEVLLYELKADMAAYLATRTNQPLRTLDDLVKFNVQRAREEMPWFRQDLFDRALQKGPLDTPAYREALVACRKLAREEGIDRTVRENKLDAIVTLTGGVAWVTDFVHGDAITGSMSTLAAVAGYPSITVPCGAVHGLPAGVLFFGPAWSEPALLRIAYAYEQATHLRTKPTFLPSLEN
ncbi:amidase [Pendulispora brunnea]|uniref:Amidase n=1 Tax=Pendulispora brunnea TaxID=2905690 RepID=A0ABZ2KLP6_9BACT